MKKNIDTTTDNIKLSDSSPFAYREAYNRLRSNVMFALAASENSSNVIVVSSAMPSEAKSSLSSNLAISLARLGKKVIIVDADLRKPKLHTIFEQKNLVGLTDVVIGNADFNSSVIKLKDLDLDFLPSGTIPPNPSELLSSSTTHSFIKSLEAEYDYVILDTPPLLVVTDALTLAPVSAGIILSCKANQTSYNDFSSVVSSLKLANFPILGTVIVGSKMSKFSAREYSNL